MDNFETQVMLSSPDVPSGPVVSTAESLEGQVPVPDRPPSEVASSPSIHTPLARPLLAEFDASTTPEKMPDPGHGKGTEEVGLGKENDKSGDDDGFAGGQDATKAEEQLEEFDAANLQAF